MTTGASTPLELHLINPKRVYSVPDPITWAGRLTWEA
jgi:hypothetical protein